MHNMKGHPKSIYKNRGEKSSIQPSAVADPSSKGAAPDTEMHEDKPDSDLI
jgi:hypothetical protein